MRSTKAQNQRRVHALPAVEFADPELSSASGLVVYQGLFQRLGLRSRLQACFGVEAWSPSFSSARVVLLLVVHLILGYQRLRETKYYRDDPMVLRVLGLRRLPDVSTVSRRLRKMDAASCGRVRALVGDLVVDRLREEGLRRVTLDFDGTVLATRRHAEGTAIGFNRKRKGTRSYYPLLCTVAQTGQVLDVLHRSGNVNDYKGALPFITGCVERVQGELGVRVEARMDAAFYSHEALERLEQMKVEYSVSVPYGASPPLRQVIEGRQRWRRIDETWSYFEVVWCSRKMTRKRRYVVYRKWVPTRERGPLQLDLYEPVSWDYQYRVVVTNKRVHAAQLLQFHNGRGAQEGVIGEIKDLCQARYIPTRSWVGNQMYLQAGLLAHNLTRELQMQVQPRDRERSAQQTALWKFEKISTIRNLMIRRAGRLINRAGRLVLRMSPNQAVRDDFERMIHAFATP